MSGVATAIGVSAVVGYVASENASNRAASAQKDAAKSATTSQERMYNQQREDLEPWRQAGIGSLSQMQNPEFQQDFKMSDFEKDPGYQFRMDEGQKALERSAAARGGLNSTGTLRNLTRYSQGVASDEYNNAYNRFNADRDRRFNRLASLAGVGQTANTQLGQAGTNYANNVSQNAMAQGNANSAQAIASGNNLSNLVSNGANSWMSYQMMNRNNGTGYTGYTASTAPATSTGYLGTNYSNFGVGGS